MTESVWLEPKEIDLAEGSEKIFSIEVDGVDEVSDIEVKAYRDGADITALVLPSGSATSSGNLITWPLLHVLAGDNGFSYIITTTCTAGADKKVRKFKVNVVSANEDAE